MKATVIAVAFAPSTTTRLFTGISVHGRAPQSECFERVASLPRVTPFTLARRNRCRLVSVAMVCADSMTPRIVRDTGGVPVLSISEARRYPPLWFIIFIIAVFVYAIRRWYVVRYLRIRKYCRDNLARDIGDFYDKRSAAWESVWGEHMHHGLYDVVDGSRLKGAQAQIRTMQELFRLGDVKLPANRALDVGCGIGGGSRFLAQRVVNVTALTLSEAQARRADALNAAVGLSDRIKTHVADVLRYDQLEAESFDLVWSLESAEHISPKSLLASTLWRVLRPGGTLLMAAWCVRESDKPFSVAEKYAIRQIMEEYCLPPLAAPSEYVTELVRAGFRNVQTVDWTDRAKPFWGEVVRSAIFDTRGLKALREHGWPLIRSALTMRHMVKAMDLGAMKLVAFTAKVPTAIEVEQEKAQTIQC